MAANNDMLIIFTIMAFFIISGFAVGLVNSEYNTGGSSVNVEDYKDTYEADAEGGITGATTAWKVLTGVAGMFFWSFGQIPLWLDLLILVPRIIFWITIARNVWVGGGG